MTNEQVTEEYAKVHPEEALPEGQQKPEVSPSEPQLSTTETAPIQKTLDKETIKLAIREAIQTRKVPEDLLAQIYVYLDNPHPVESESSVQDEPLKIFNDIHSVLLDIKKLLSQMKPQSHADQPSATASHSVTQKKFWKPVSLKRATLYGLGAFGLVFLIGLIIEIAVRL